MQSQFQLRIRTSTNLRVLFDDLAATIEADPLPPLEREVVVVARNTGLRTWLELQLATRLGCAASLHTPSPRGFSAELVRRFVPQARPLEGGRSDPFEAEGLTWQIYKLLADPEESEGYRAVAAYLRDADDGSGAARIRLAARLARQFDNYQIYRSDILAAWERGERCLPDWPHENWQADLWRQLTKDTSALSRAAELDQLIQVIHAWDEVPSGLPRRLSIFGARVFPPVYFRVLHALSRHIPITFYAVLPSTVQAASANPLGLHLGGQAQEFLAILSELHDPAPTLEPVPTAVPPRDCALRILQADYLENIERETPVPYDAGDHSVRVHDCHGPLREMEVLRDQLLDAFDSVPGLRPDEVLILVPDVTAYAPLVDAVFGSSPADGSRLPYHVVGHPRSPGRQTLEAWERLLRFPGTRATATALLDLLEYPVIRRSARITGDELTALREWACQTNVCWGIDGAQKVSFGLPDDGVHTWQHGLDRLVLGYMVGEMETTVADVLPYAGLGPDAGDLLGRFAQWADTLFGAMSRTESLRSLDEWATELSRVLEDLLVAEDAGEMETLKLLRTQVSELRTLHQLVSEADAPITFATIRAHLLEILSLLPVEERPITGRITISDFLTLQHAPYRVVAAIGLNDGTFPRATALADLDAMSQHRRPGDPDPRAMDKQLFLDALLAAEDRLILNYIGRSQRDNSERAASLVLDVLVNTCRTSLSTPEGEATDRLIVRHPLQPFDQACFDGRDNRLFSYSDWNCVSRGPARVGPAPFFIARLSQEPAQIEVTLDELAGAWSNPSRDFCRRLGIRLEDDDTELRDEEPIRFDALEAYSLKTFLLEHRLRGASRDHLYSRLRAEGRLPPGKLGWAWLNHLYESIDSIAEAVTRLGEGVGANIYLEGDGWRLAGYLKHVTQEGSLFFRCAKVKPADLIKGWIAHLALNAHAAKGGETDPRTTWIIGEDGTFRFRPVENPLAHLHALVEGSRTFSCEPPPLFPLASQAYVETRDPAKRWHKAQQAYRSGFRSTGDDADPYIGLAYRGRNPLADEQQFGQWAATLWEPLLRHREEGTP